MSETHKIVPIPTGWMEEVRQANRPKNAEGFSSEELGKQLGMTTRTAQRWVSEAVKAGKLRMNGKRHVEGADGRSLPVAVYVEVKKRK